MKNTQQYIHLGRSLKESKDVKGAIEAFKQAITIDNTSVPAHFNLAYLLESEKEYLAALHHYSQVILIRPDYVIAHYNRALLCIKLGELDQAIEDFNKVIALDPKKPDAVRGKAFCVLTKMKSQDNLGDISGSSNTENDKPEKKEHLKYDKDLMHKQTILEMFKEKHGTEKLIYLLTLAEQATQHHDTSFSDPLKLALEGEINDAIQSLETLIGLTQEHHDL